MTFFVLIFVKNVSFVRKRPKINKKRPGLVHLKKDAYAPSLKSNTEKMK